MSDLPDGWRTVELQEVADLALGKMLDREKRREGTPLPYLRNINVRWNAFDLDDLLEMPFKEDELQKFSLQRGDVLICEGGEPGRAAVWNADDRPIKFQKAILRARPRTDALPQWIMYSLMRNAKSGALEEYFTGSTIKHFPKVAASRYRLPLPPLPEQRRIVAKLEALLARVDAARDRLGNVPAILKRFRQSVLAAACSGRLTEDWNGRRSTRNGAAGRPRVPAEKVPLSDEVSEMLIPDEWQSATAEVLCDRDRAITYGVIKLGPPVDGGVPTLRSSDVHWMYIDPDDIKCISRHIADQYSRTYLRGGEVLVTVRGTLGGIGVVPVEMAGYNISREVAQLPLRTGVDSEFVMYAVASPTSQNWLAERAKGVAYTGINIEDLRRLPLPLPSLPEQQEIVCRIEALFALADAIERRVAATTAHAEKLTHAILAKAFRGELVPNEEEPARPNRESWENLYAPRSTF